MHCSTHAAASFHVKRATLELSHMGSSMFMKGPSVKPMQYIRMYFLVTILLLTSALHSLW